jgi:hypothetical protein
MALGRDLKAFTRADYALEATSVTAGSPGAGDGVDITGETIDLQGKPKAESVVFEVPCTADLDNAETLIVQGHIEYSDDGSDWTDLDDAETILTLTGDSVSGGSVETGVARIGADLTLCDRYIRVIINPNLSADDTDTATVGAGVAVFGGLQEAPQTS